MVVSCFSHSRCLWRFLHAQHVLVSQHAPLAMTLCLCLAFTAAGCDSDDGLNRKAIEGKVTANGVAIPNGSIAFEPLYEKGVGSGAVITQGSYSIAKQHGLPPGKYRVQMTGDDGVNFVVSEGKMPGDEVMPPKKKLVPPGWKQEIEVTEAGPFEFNFDVKTKK